MSPFCVAEAACFSQNEQKLTLETRRCSQKEIELNFLSSEAMLLYDEKQCRVVTLSWSWPWSRDAPFRQETNQQPSKAMNVISTVLSVCSIL